ncbi:E3 SUMO-protein ligase ZBED1-like [Metopolophium dirhodum]|uniref:E3 SUMO-protein ligase ZBED1-like n=1 Tax=Metopolophium dirhodum TaxID=44670 RepID=UPI0029903D84|nr:E3 SUMO-protein ligase ZBED1-like [Metopolophium dirhodum]
MASLYDAFSNWCHWNMLVYANHLKRKHPTALNVTLTNEDDPDSEVQNVQTLASTSTSIAFPTSSITSEQNCIPPAKRQRQLKLFGSTKKNQLSDTENKSIDKALIKMIIADYQPLSIVENIGFLEYSKMLQPLYYPPNSNKGYITVTCHFIFDDKLYSPVLATREVHGAHTGENIAAVLSEIFNEWEINNKIVTIVSDNGANIKNAINIHLQKYHHPCVAHTLNLSVSEAITNNTELSQVLKSCKIIVGHFKHSTFANEKLKNYQIQMGLPQLKVKQDVPTRWNWSLIMMERLLEIKAPLSAALTSLPRAPNGLTAIEWELIEDCIPLLKPFESMTT